MAHTHAVARGRDDSDQPIRRRARWTLAASASIALVSGLLATSPALADSKPSDPADPKTPQTVSADVLATPQIDGVVWDQLVVGNTVYVGGKFTTARPAGSAAGKNTVTRSNLLAYNLTTGELQAFAPAFNQQVRTLAVSPDKKTLYVGGAFTTVTPTGGAAATRNRIAAFTIGSGALVAGFAPSLNGEVTTIAATSSSVYAGGAFSSAQKTARAGLAAFAPTNAALQKWAPSPSGGSPRALVVSPDAKKVVVGGSFTTLNGSSDPGFGLGAVTADTGTLLPWKVNSVIRNGGSGAAVYSLSSDADNVYATAFSYKAAIQSPYTEGTYAARWSDGELVWHEDCHGDTYSSAPAGDVVYTAGHAHDCERVGGFGDMVKSVSATAGYHRALAFSNAATGMLTAATGDLYTDFAGQPAPSLLDWYPYFNVGKASGSGQGPWDVTVSGGYVLYGGEFTVASGKSQQGLARFQIPSKAPNLRGPELSGDDMAPKIEQLGAGAVRLTWAANYDPDNRDLRYEVYRSGVSEPVATLEGQSRFWDRPTMHVVDSGLTAGKAYAYTIKTIDPYENSTKGTPVTITPTGAGSTSLTDYDHEVLADGPTSYWPLNETAGTRAIDYAGTDDITLAASVKREGEGAEGAAAGYSSTFSGATAAGVARDRADAPLSVSTELWFASTASGRLLDFADPPQNADTAYDLGLDLRADGRLSFAMTSNTAIATEKAYNDGEWHHVVTTLGPEGSTIQVDGVVRASSSTSTSTRPIIGGTWRLSNGFTGRIDNVAVYDRVLSASEITDHFTAVPPTEPDPVALTDYDRLVISDEPMSYWPLNETDGVQAVDQIGTNDVTLAASVTRKSEGAEGATGGYSSTFPSVRAGGFGEERVKAPGSVSTELWFASTGSGRLLDLADQPQSAATGYDLSLELRSDGRLSFAMTSNTAVATDAAYNDGEWHHVVTTLGPSGTTIRVDGVVRASSSTSTSSRPIIDGSWRFASGFTGRIDNVAVYDRALSASEITEHSTAGRPEK